MKTHKWKDIRAKNRPAKALAEVDRRVEEELRIIDQRSEGMTEALDKLASLFPSGELLAESTPAVFVVTVAEEVERLRAAVTGTEEELVHTREMRDAAIAERDTWRDNCIEARVALAPVATERDGARGQLAELRIEHERLASSVRLANQVAEDQTLSEGEMERVRASLDPLRALVATLTAERDSARAELLAEKIALARSLAEVKEMAERLAAKHGNIEGANFDLRAALRACLDELKANEIWPGWADRAEDLLR